MARLIPRPFESLLAQALAEHERDGSVFGLPRRSFWAPRPGLDLSVELSAGLAGTPVGPAAGPHTQLAPNLVAAWLAGARVLELKTVQAAGGVEVPRPCIDAPHAGWNVEWSQELGLDDAAQQYVAAWHLIHVLGARAVAGPLGSTHFEASVGYDLAGVSSDAVARFLESLADASEALAAQRDGLPPGMRAAADVPVPPHIVHAVTLSTFHGCPPEEIERIVGHVFDRHGLDVIVKLNPTLLGFDETDALLRGTLGYTDIALDPAAFERDLGWAEAMELVARLSGDAARRGRTLGLKLTNTLVTRNTRGRLPGATAYLSGPPLHVLAITLAARVAETLGSEVPLSFSAGLDAENVADVVACGFAPVTTCTDLLRPTGYRRLPRYLKALEAALEGAGARDLEGLILARAGVPAAGPSPPAVTHGAALANLKAYAARVAADPRYHAAAAPAAPERPTALRLFDCESCNACVTCCPNGAFLGIPMAPLSMPAPELVVQGDTIQARQGWLETRRDRQWVVCADACNECGNCDTFCPESGGPWRAKPSFHGSRESFDASAPADAILIEQAGAFVRARFAGRVHELERTPEGARFTDGVVAVAFDRDHMPMAARVVEPVEGHVLPLARYYALRMLTDGVMKSVNPLSAPFLPRA